MPRTDKYTGRIRVTGELSATNVVNYGRSGAIRGMRVVPVKVVNYTCTDADSGSLILAGNVAQDVYLTLANIESSNGSCFKFLNVNSAAMYIRGATNCIMTSRSVNATDRFRTIDTRSTINFGTVAEFWGDGTTYYLTSGLSMLPATNSATALFTGTTTI